MQTNTPLHFLYLKRAAASTKVRFTLGLEGSVTDEISANRVPLHGNLDDIPSSGQTAIGFGIGCIGSVWSALMGNQGHDLWGLTTKEIERPEQTSTTIQPIDGHGTKTTIPYTKFNIKELPDRDKCKTVRNIFITVPSNHLGGQGENLSALSSVIGPECTPEDPLRVFIVVNGKKDPDQILFKKLTPEAQDLVTTGSMILHPVIANNVVTRKDGIFYAETMPFIVKCPEGTPTPKEVKGLQFISPKAFEAWHTVKKLGSNGLHLLLAAISDKDDVTIKDVIDRNPKTANALVEEITAILCDMFKDIPDITEAEITEYMKECLSRFQQNTEDTIARVGRKALTKIKDGERLLPLLEHAGTNKIACHELATAFGKAMIIHKVDADNSEEEAAYAIVAGTLSELPNCWDVLEAIHQRKSDVVECEVEKEEWIQILKDTLGETICLDIEKGFSAGKDIHTKAEETLYQKLEDALDQFLPAEASTLPTGVLLQEYIRAMDNFIAFMGGIVPKVSEKTLGERSPSHMRLSALADKFTASSRPGSTQQEEDLDDRQDSPPNILGPREILSVFKRSGSGAAFYQYALLKVTPVSDH